MCRSVYLVLAVGVALAAPWGAADTPVLEEVLVTARRDPEAVQWVPLAISVLTRESLESATIDGLSDIAIRTPGLGYEAQFSAGGGVPTMRGLSPPNAPADNVAVFVDGVHQAEQEAYDADLLDIERVEIINGPQSSLFGYSSFAGAIRYVSRTPTPAMAWGYRLEAGSDAWRGAQGWWSGPLPGTSWLGRIAAGLRGADGSLSGDVTPDALGGSKRGAFALAMTRGVEAPDDWNATLRLRHSTAYAQHPYVSSIGGADYNCGAVDPATGYWSYYCGHAPIEKTIALSAGLPDSRSQSTQASLALELPLQRLRLASLTSVYRGEARIVRDFDASANGLLFGVCTDGVSCPGGSRPGSAVDRLVTVNEVRVGHERTDEFTQEFRLVGPGGGDFDWALGIVYLHTPSRSYNAIGAERGDLREDELLATYFSEPTYVVRSVSLLSEALVEDPLQEQVEINRSYETRNTWATFGTADLPFLDAFRLRAEWRFTWERLQVESVRENFNAGRGRFPAGEFHDFTPRLSVDYSPTDNLMVYASAAKGSHSGGVNRIPELPPEERTFDPEYNWTYELGGRYAGPDMLSTLNVTLFATRWRDAQGFTFSSNPGVSNLITSNIGGIDTKGIEMSAVTQPLVWLRGEISYSRVDSRFRDGTDDPSSRVFCGLTGGNTTSSFCVVGPPRSSASGAPLVPWIDSNFVARTPQTMWHAAVVLMPPIILGWRMALRSDISHQGDMYERNLENLQFGDRTLLNIGWSMARGPWVLELWGRNLTDERYQRSAFARGNLLLPTSTRPIDFIYSDGRRIGISLSRVSS